jgi:hypothetical protein
MCAGPESDMAYPGFECNVQVLDSGKGVSVARASLLFTGQSPRDMLQHVWQALEDDVLPACAACDYAYFDFTDVGRNLRELAAVLAFGIDEPFTEDTGFRVAPFAPDVLFRVEDATSSVLARHVLLERARQDPCFRHLTEQAVHLVSSGLLTDRADFANQEGKGEFASLALLCAAGQVFLGRTRQLQEGREGVCGPVADALADGMGHASELRLPLRLFIRRPPVDGRALDKYRARCA